jgi:hypothetical protein
VLLSGAPLEGRRESHAAGLAELFLDQLIAATAKLNGVLGRTSSALARVGGRPG